MIHHSRAFNFRDCWEDGALGVVNIRVFLHLYKIFVFFVTFHLRQPMAFLSHNLISTCMPARACSSYACFILRAVRLSSSKLLEQGYVRERLKSSLRKFYGRYGDLIKHYEVPLSQILHDILGHGHLQWHPQLIRHYTNLWTYYRTGPYYRFWPYYHISGGFRRTLQRVRLANRGRLLLRTSGPVPFGTCICSNVETILSWTCHVYGPFKFRTSLGTSILLGISYIGSAVG